MKKILTILLLATCFLTETNAQIQLSSDDVYHKGSFQMTLDTSGGFDPGTPGANKIWNFSGLKSHIPFQFNFVAFDGKGNGNDANLVKVDGLDTFDFIQKTGSEIYNVSPLQDLDKVIYKKLRTFNFPLNFNSVNKDSFTMVSYCSGIQFGIPSLDSIQLFFKTVYDSKADAWGVLKLPAANYNTIRIKSETKGTLRLSGKQGSMPYIPMHNFDQDEDIIQYLWFGKDKGNYLAAYDPNTDEMEYMVSGILSNTSIYDNADIIIANPFLNEMIIKNKGANNYGITLFDINGQLVLSENIENNSSKTINTSNLSSGVYTMQLLNIETQALQFRKLLKE